MRHKGRKRDLIKKLHKWPSLVVAFFIIIWAFSGIILNHRYLFSSVDVNRALMPAEHHYRNWNNAAVRGSVRIDSLKFLLYGNVGAWEYDEIEESWRAMNSGFPGGADHYKINCMILSNQGDLLAGTRYGLYKYDRERDIWTVIDIPHSDKHVVDLMEMNGFIWVMTRSHLWKTDPIFVKDLAHIPIPAPEGYDNKVGLFKTLWVIHSGEIYGQAGKLFVDGVALIFVFLTLSGLVYFFFPRWMKRRKKKDLAIKRLAYWNRWSVKWHNKIGIWLVAILLITTFTGMFLRPPLLIAIASGRVAKIPLTVLDDGNPWFDQLRRIVYDESYNVILLATSEGIFAVDKDLKYAPKYVYPQPPASVMGYNVFCENTAGNILVGSFSGIFEWNPGNGQIIDMVSGLPHNNASAPGIPISDNMISGYHVDRNGLEYLFDYNKGVLIPNPDGTFPVMPEQISESRMPLWNVALEMHTARLLKPLLGDFYILFIPLFGLTAIIILISGSILWIRKFKRNSERKI
ncbi:MAG TPA: PepSY-associated TM helix domain-containing protein [Bacteroidales bacterium]|nr:PepSY-associated TM helix domain-containing protein [Bacteroidales bacterium]